MDEVCDLDGRKLVIRNDDREEVIRERLDAYEQQTRPVADYYRDKQRLIRVNGDVPVPEVTIQICRAIEHQSNAVESG